MTVPPLPLRSKANEETTSVQAKPTGNELANPAVLVEVAILLGEFAAQHGAKTILYAVTIQVVAAVAVEGYKKLSEECRRAKEACIISCGSSTLPTGWLHGIPFHKCMRDCMEAAGCFHGQ